MAHVIKLIYGSPASWSYIDLTSSSYGNLDYYPGTPDPGADDIIESGTWRIAGSSIADLLGRIEQIDMLFHRARTYDIDQIGAYQVWLTIQPDGVAETWQSQIFEGRLELTENILGFDWANKETEVILTWRRAPWWEKYTQLTISNSNGSGLSTTIYNNGDGTGSAPTKKVNWIDIAATQVKVDLPSPTNLIFSGAGFAGCIGFIVVNNALTNPTGANLIEGETGTGDTTDAARSGGKYHIYTTPVGANGVDVSSFTNSLTGLKDGAWLRFLLSANFTGTIYATPFINLGTGRYYGTRNIIQNGGVNFYTYDLGLLRIPLADMTGVAGLASGLANMQVGVNLYAESAIAVSVDYFNYIPTDYFSQVEMIGMSLDIASINSHDRRALGNRDYPTVSAVGSIGTMYGSIFLEPTKAQRLTFKLIDGLYGDVMTNYATVEVYAWLRKRTL